MLARIVQLRKCKGTKPSHNYCCEVFKEDTKEWIFVKNPYCHFKNCKVRFHENMVYLVGTVVTDTKEIGNLQELLRGEVLDWNDDQTTYKYVEWLDFFEAYC